MAVKIGINGFGRIGRVVLRQALAMPERFEVCAVNYRNVDLEYMKYMMKYDSTFGRFPGTVEVYEKGLIFNGVKVPVFSEGDAAQVPWGAVGAEYIVESTGAYVTAEKSAAHLAAGAKKVVITAPAKDNSPTFVMGVNHNDYTSDMTVVSNASCTTNCLAPLVKVVNDEFGIIQGLMSTIHSATAKQKVVDARSMKDWRTGRSVFGNIIPSTTGAAKACGLVIPEVKGKLTGMSFRIPAADVSVIDLTARLEKSTTYDEVCAAVKKATETTMKGVMAYYDEQVVSLDFLGDTHTCNFDASSGIMIDDNFIKLLAWYDNEWGYSNKVLMLIEHMAEVDAR
ncbi:MAG: type I glyceraldehyde-3-phosphate dehydrogenase [Candidatus Fimivivens sp.]|nr:type I glyceraldehyde-3-phosphate dehydrogenase [Candidatus Fimivivens sp.]